MVTALYEVIPVGPNSTSSVDDLKYQKSENKTQFGEELLTVKFRYKEPKENATFDSVLELAKKSKWKDENGYRAEFINLVRLAKEIYKVG